MRLSALKAVAYAAIAGRDRILADGYFFDAGEFTETVRLLVRLGQLAILDEPRKLPETGPAMMLTTADVAHRVGVSSAAVTLAARTGRLTGVRGPAGWQFTVEQVESWEASR